MRRGLILVLGLLLAAGAFGRWTPPVGAQNYIRSHASARGADVSHANALSIQVVGPDGRVAAVSASGQLSTSASVTVDTITHITSVLHVAAARPLPVVQSPSQTRFAVDSHQAGQWNLDSVGHVKSAMAHVIGTVTIEGRGTAGTAVGGVVSVQGVAGGVPAAISTLAHVSSTVHVAGIMQAGTGSGNLVCHSTAAFATSANAILIHAAGANRIFICGIVFVASAASNVSLVEGTGAACSATSTALLGAHTAANGLAIAANGGLSSIAPFPWLASQTAGNNICLLLSAGRVSGVITYRGAP